MSSGFDPDAPEAGVVEGTVRMSGNFVVDQDDAGYREALAKLDGITAEWSAAMARFREENGL